MARWSIRNYNAFIREVRAAHNLSLAEARRAYSLMSAHLHRSLYGTDVKRHPRLAKRFAEQARKLRIENLAQWQQAFKKAWLKLKPQLWEGTAIYD